MPSDCGRFGHHAVAAPAANRQADLRGPHLRRDTLHRPRYAGTLPRIPLARMRALVGAAPTFAGSSQNGGGHLISPGACPRRYFCPPMRRHCLRLIFYLLSAAAVSCFRFGSAAAAAADFLMVQRERDHKNQFMRLAGALIFRDRPPTMPPRHPQRNRPPSRVSGSPYTRYQSTNQSVKAYIMFRLRLRNCR